MPKVRTFTVEGREAFPLDMLRYDQCWPATLDDAVTIADTLTAHVGLVKVTLCGYHDPSKELWESWEWRLVLLN
jgi:hypothetical protein